MNELGSQAHRVDVLDQIVPQFCVNLARSRLVRARLGSVRLDWTSFSISHIQTIIEHRLYEEH
jgi:hypothetical protein